jgi:hypothetical protein
MLVDVAEVAGERWLALVMPCFRFRFAKTGRKRDYLEIATSIPRAYLKEKGRYISPWYSLPAHLLGSLPRASTGTRQVIKQGFLQGPCDCDQY